jgi:hypothetical protein
LLTRPGLRDLAKEQYWRGVIAKRAASGEPSRAEFCKAEGIKPTDLANWERIIEQRDHESRIEEQRRRRQEYKKEYKKRMRIKQAKAKRDAKPKSLGPDAFVPLSFIMDKQFDGSGTLPIAEVRVGSIVVTIFAGADSVTLVALLSALRECGT